MPHQIRSVCVFCGSNRGSHPAYLEAATAVGRMLAERGLTMVYGGGRIGLMGATADAAVAAGGKVHGVIPHFLARKEVAHAGLTELDEVESMHERKARMAELSDAFIALPGGAGTLEEVAEVWTWAQLGLHAKPIGFLNVAGYFDHLFAFVDHAVAEAFINPVHAQLLIRNPRIGPLLDALSAGGPATGAPTRWLSPDQT
jgi:uncharacterized protein (TIGR00730 family)